MSEVRPLLSRAIEAGTKNRDATKHDVRPGSRRPQGRRARRVRVENHIE